MKSSDRVSTNRRSFIKETAVLGGAIALNSTLSSSLFASNSPTLKVGLIGCGGRGTGAAVQALRADPNVVITAMGDVFEDKLEEAYSALIAVAPSKVKVKKSHKFIGFDAYQKVIDSGVDVVLLATPPAFRPDHLTLAIDLGKHVFCEKPVAVDAPGVKKVLAAAQKAKDKKLSIVSGFCFRYDYSLRSTFEKIFNGDIGDIKAITTFRFGGELWSHPRQEGWTDLNYQMRNWLYYNWLSGDFVVEQAVHSLDMMSWIMGDIMPVKAIGTGGRQVRVDEIYGNVYDHFAVEFEYANGAKGIHFARQHAGVANRNTVDVLGTKGDANIAIGRKYQISGKQNWQYDGAKNNMYQTQHDEFFEAIRKGEPINDGEYMANSTMLAIWTRMVGYSGQAITWDEAINSNISIGPDIKEYHWNLKVTPSPVAIPGITRVL